MFLARVLEPPRYGWSLAGQPDRLSQPSRSELWSELIYRMNVFRDRKNWLVAWAWGLGLALEIPAVLYLIRYFSWPSFFLGALYGLVVLPTVHNTFFLHRYCAHHAFDFRNRFWLQVARNFTWRLIPEETYAISHHVHHAQSESPGDPYNAKAGWLYCFLADGIHQSLARNLDRDSYAKVARMMAHTGVRANSYEEYRHWGTVAHPLFTILDTGFNWALWIAIFYAIGGAPLLFSMFAWTTFWNWGIRTFNFRAHAGGKTAHRDGRDFHREDLSINLPYPGFVAGEWHNNHHLLPGSARAGYLAHQLDLPWILIRTLHALGIVRSYRDMTAEFHKLSGTRPRGLWAQDWRDSGLVALSALELACLLAPALLGLVPELTAGWLAFGAFLIFLNCTNYQCVAHNLIHCPFFRSEMLNRVFSCFNTLALGVPQTLYRVHHLNHHRYNNDLKNSVTGQTGDRSSIYRFAKGSQAESLISYSFLGPIRTEFGFLFEGAKKLGVSRLARVETILLVAFLAFVATISWKYFAFFFLPVWYLGQVAAFAENYLEHIGADPRRFEANSVSSYGRLYNWIWFNNGYHQEHHCRPTLHWSRLPPVRSTILAENERRTVPWAHAAALFQRTRTLNPPGSYGVLTVHETAGLGESHAAQDAVCRRERRRGQDGGLPGPFPPAIPSRQTDPVDLF